MISKQVIVLFILVTITIKGCICQYQSQGCDQRSCYPATGNLLIGREDKLSATDTCGLEKQERFCILSSLDPHGLQSNFNTKREKCYWCNGMDENLNHNVSKIVHRWEPPDSPRKMQRMTWFQSSNGVEKVSINLKLEAEFHVTHLIITFKTFRPAAMVIEKSFDWGDTYQPQRYFAHDCKRYFPHIHKGVPRTLNETVCQERYSRLTPSTKGEVIYRVLPPNININTAGFDPYSKEVQDLLKTTNLRITFEALHTLGDENLEDSPVNVKEKYYYSIYDMVIRGSCSCYGHAESCIPERPELAGVPGMIHGTCKCQHNTEGDNCEKCNPFYHDKPWLPATGKKKNECKRCNCNEHSDKCHFDNAYYEAKGGDTGGVCDNCQHYTQGPHCQDCIDMYYQDPNKRSTDPDFCAPCDCEADGTTNEGLCDGFTDECVATGECDPATDDMIYMAGKCHCKTFIDGPRCDRCMDGYWNMTVENVDGCQQCTCDTLGTVDNQGCHKETGECTCKRFVTGRDCDQCLPQHYGLSADQYGCKACDCDPGGSYNNDCDVNSGQCSCRPNIMGRRCDEVIDYYYTGPLDYLTFEGELAHGSDTPHTKVIMREPERDTTWTGLGHMQVFEGSTLTFDIPPMIRTLEYYPVVRFAHQPTHNQTWDYVTIELERIDGEKDPDGLCGSATDGPTPFQLEERMFQTEINHPLCLEEGQQYQIHLKFVKYDPSVQNPGANIYIDSMSLIPNIDQIPFLDPYWSGEGGDGSQLPRQECQEVEVEVECPTTLAPPPADTEAPPAHTEVTDPPLVQGSGDGEGCGDGEPVEDGDDVVQEDVGARRCTEKRMECKEVEAPVNEGVVDHAGGPGERNKIIGWSPGRDQAQNNKETFDRWQCRNFFLTAKPARQQEIPAECIPLLHSISYYVFEGAFDRGCDCSPTGSNSVLCDKYYGGCECKTMVEGRSCARCAPASFGFGSSGCTRCDCHHLGAQDKFCDQDTGKCNCYEQRFGRQCDQCQPGYWNFPHCRQCKCNGHADICDPKNGICTDCRDNTHGEFCDQCLVGYYGHPELGPDYVPCRDCPCPGTKLSLHSYADSCYLDTTNNQPVCNCEDGYGRDRPGERCDMCSENFYGHPEIPGGKCQQCDCSHNTDTSDEVEGNCDAQTGECLKCLFFTEGWNCHVCQAGYFGDAVNNQCSECQCSLLGTDPERRACDRDTGACNCLPNVEGHNCESCIANHWKIASGEGCVDCACDPVGSTGTECNLYTGQCDCKPGFGGDRCDQCEKDFWGDPTVECKPCNCNQLGVHPDKTQCDHATGVCHCLPGIGGEKCDECDIGYVQDTYLSVDNPVRKRKIPYGETPNCIACGECFDNWDRILNGLSNETELKISEARKVQVTGSTGAYHVAFEVMEKKLNEVKGILKSSSISNQEIAGVQQDIDQINEQLQGTSNDLGTLDQSLSDNKQAILSGQSKLNNLRQEAERLVQSSHDIRDQATQLQEANVGGALQLTQEAMSRSDQALRQVSQITEEVSGAPLYDSERQRKATKQLINSTRDRITSNQDNNRQALQDILLQIGQLEDKVPELNSAVCDGDTSREKPCDELCGGAGCGRCGGLSCQNGALTKADEAVQSAKQAESILADKDLEAEGVLREVMQLHNDAREAKGEAQAAFDMATAAKERSTNEMDMVKDLSGKVDAFLTDEKASPEQVREVAYQCLNATMTMDNSQIQEIAEKINIAIGSVTDVEQINKDTEGPLAKAKALKNEADLARAEAATQLSRAENVTNSLGLAETAQSEAGNAINEANANIEKSRRHLATIDSEMDVAVEVSTETFDATSELLARQKTLQTVYIANENHVKSAQQAAEKAKLQARRAGDDLYQLNAGFKNVSSNLETKTTSIGTAKDKAVDLQKRANSLANSASNKLTNLFDMEKEYEENERQLKELSDQLLMLNCQMEVHLKVIQDKSDYYRNCQSPGSWTPKQNCCCKAGQPDPKCVPPSEQC